MIRTGSRSGRVDRAKNQETGGVRREAAFAFIFATVLLDMLAVGIIIPVLPKLVFDFLGGNAAADRKNIWVFSARPGR